MTQTALSANDLNLLRTTDSQYVHNHRLNIVYPQTVATATVSAVPTTTPFVNLTVTGTSGWSDVRVGQLLRVMDGDTHKTWAVVRKTPTSTILYISPVSIGDSGYTSRIENAIEAGDTITIYSHRALWGLYSTIQSKTFLKQWDVAYTDQNEEPPPVSNVGPWQSAEIESGSATFTLPKSGVNSSFAFGGAAITDTDWTLPAGVSLVSGYALTDSVIEVTATPGQYLVSCTVTDDNAKTHTAYTWLFVSDQTTYTSFGKAYPFLIESDNQTLDGREMTFQISADDLDTDVVLPGAGLLFEYDIAYGGEAVSDGVLTNTFIGYISALTPAHDGETGQVVLTVQAPYLYAKDSPLPSQSLTEVGNAANWAECSSALSNPRGILYYILKWHCPTLLDMHDLDAGSLTTPRNKNYTISAGSIAQGMAAAAQDIIGNVGSASDGTTVLRQNPNYEDNTYRNALPIAFTIGAGDIIAPLEYGLNFRVANSEVRTGAFAYDGTTVKAWRGIKRWYQGVASSTLPDFSVTMAQGLQRVKEVVGHHMATLNSDIPDLTFNFARLFDVIDPPYMIWYRANISAAYDPRGVGFSNVRLLPMKVTRKWSEEGELDLQATFTVETFGQPGEELPIGGGGAFSSNTQVIPYEPQQTQGDLPDIALALNAGGKLGITYDFTSATPHYRDLSALFAGTVCDACFDYNSDYFADGYITTSALSVYVVSADDTDLNVYRIYDIQTATLQVDLLHTYSMDDDSTTTSARVAASVVTTTFAAVCWRDQTGTFVGRTSDGGATWASAVRVGSAVTDTNNDNAELGFVIDDTVQVASGPNSSTEYGIYKATGSGSFSALTSTPVSESPSPLIVLNYADSLYVAFLGSAGSGGYTVDFDGGYGSYSLTNTAGVTGETLGVEAVGNGGGNAARCSGASVAIASSADIELEVDITITSATVTGVSMDVYYNRSGGYNPSMQCWARDQGGSTLLNGATNTVTFGTSWDTKAITGISITSVTTVKFSLEHTGGLGSGTINDLDLRLDNLIIEISGGVPATDPTLQRVDDYAGTPAWNDITPAGDFTPRLPYALGVDVLDSVHVEMFASDGVDTNWFSSANDGDNWTDNSVADGRIIKALGDLQIVGGVDLLAVSVDAGATFYDKTGDLVAAWGSIGTIKHILILAG